MATFTYYMPDGSVEITSGANNQMNHVKASDAFLVTVCVPANGNSAPFVEIVKSRYGPSSVIMTADMTVSQQYARNLAQQFRPATIRKSEVSE